MGLILLTAPAIEPLTSHEVAVHLRLDSSNLEPVPSAPSVALGSGAGNVENGIHRYRVTFVTADGHTDGGDISDIVTVVDKTVNGKVTLTDIPLGGSLVTSRKIYRTVAGGSSYLLLTTLADNTTTTYADNTADASLGAGIPTSNTTSDPYIAGLIQTAREVAENYLKRALIQQKWTLVRDCFEEVVIRLPMPNLISVDAIRYRDFAGDWQTLDTGIYEVYTSELPGTVVRKWMQIWPILYPGGHLVVQIDFTAGYGTTRASIPQAIKNGMLLLIGELHENRESLNVGNVVNELPALSRLWATHRYMEAY